MKATSRNRAAMPVWAVLATAAALVGVHSVRGAGQDAGQAKPSRDARIQAAEKTMGAQLRRFGPGYRGKCDLARGLVCVAALDETHLTKTLGRLGSFSDAMSRTVGMGRRKWLVTVILPTASDYATLAPAENVRGFYDPSEKMLISIDRGRVLVHEFTHALHHADYAAAGQEHVIWVREGLATLFEASAISRAGLQPQVDIRLLTLQKATRLNRTVALDRLVRMSREAFMSSAEICYAQARYLLLYLHQQGKLRQWYAAYKAGFDQDPTGRVAMEQVLGQKLYQIERDWKGWVGRLQLPWGERIANRARLGLELRDTRAGAKVVGLAKDSPAALAGRIEVGDIITSFNGHQTRNVGEVIGAIQAAGAMQTVAVELRRGGRKLTVLQPLGAPRSH